MGETGNADETSGARGFEYRADLAETALPEMLYTIDRFRVPGVIEAERDGITKRVHVKEGHVVHATSTDRHDRLGPYLQRTGRITAEQFAKSMESRSEEPDKLYGQILVERGALSPAEIRRAIVEQVESIVWSLFYWEQGEVRFHIGAPPEPTGIRTQLPMSHVILEGIRRAPNAKSLVARLGQKDTLYEPCFTTEQLISVGLEDDEYALLTLVDGRRSLYEICTAGVLPPAESGKLMYAFQVMRLIGRPASAAPPGKTAPCDETAAPARETPADGDGETPNSRKVIKIRMKTTGDKFGE